MQNRSPELAANRLQRYAIFMSAYNYKIEHIKSDVSWTVDESQGCPEVDLVDRATYINFIADTLQPVTVQAIYLATNKDSVLLRMKSYIKKGGHEK